MKDHKNPFDKYISYAVETIYFDVNKYVDELIKDINKEIERKLEDIGYVKVVKCRDCKHFKFAFDIFGTCKFFNKLACSYDYCSYGERKKQ